MKLVMLVDDDTVANYLHQSIIVGMNITDKVQLAQDGVEALLYLKDLNEESCCPDLILLDLRMPILDGFEFLQLYQRMSFTGKEDIKIVALSSSERQDDRQRAMDLGAVDYLVKPLSDVKLRQILEKHF